MTQYHKFAKSKKSGSGGLKRQSTDKRLVHTGGFQHFAKLEKEAKSEVRKLNKGKGKTFKVRVKHALFANVVTEPGKVKKVKILNVKETPSNQHFSRENVLVKGAVIETEAGKARITSRPSQTGVVNATLIK